MIHVIAVITAKPGKRDEILRTLSRQRTRRACRAPGPFYEVDREWSPWEPRKVDSSSAHATGSKAAMSPTVRTSRSSPSATTRVTMSLARAAMVQRSRRESMTGRLATCLYAFGALAHFDTPGGTPNTAHAGVV